MDITEIFLEALERNPEKKEQLEEAIILVKPFSEGKMRVIGGFVYRNILNQMHGLEIPLETDVDIVVEDHGGIVLPKTWYGGDKSYGGFKFINTENGHIVDYLRLRDFARFREFQREVDLGYFLKTTPLNIQSIAYDVESGVVIGDRGINAILDRRIDVNYLPEAREYALRNGVKISDVLESKAEELGFQVQGNPLFD